MELLTLEYKINKPIFFVAPSDASCPPVVGEKLSIYLDTNKELSLHYFGYVCPLSAVAFEGKEGMTKTVNILNMPD